ncbi:UDP-N-acetylglucosamine 2-epimerase [Candidatus Pelagibacter sp. RS40]|uniref:UDP-N-acetylglucosamine 2-epimerase n=1 Tax=Candidatus Pelagibacter sp. RS40 TaxID=1977865 RepID=UPI000A15B3EE|nr:UDP-N-acetylglucosamine 2-epimerase [Candidatus Pelagibacter sp. RS40]ARJ49231.1 UDP-N-acetylglucosamine 2-epimerase (hydrolyzing) [Candidatus Pelagibacter sp. RS40]
MKRKICIITGSRAEYGLLYWLIREVNIDKNLELQLIVTGMHLSAEFGLTYKEIEKDFKIDMKIDMHLSSDTAEGISSSMGIAQKSFSEAYSKLKPDIIVVLGDRYEIFSAVTAAMISRIPIAHIHGGEATEGSIDEAIRHSITKMSHLHFTATEEYSKRVIQLGENPDKVFTVGGMGVENIKRLTLFTKEEFEKLIDFKLNIKNILVTFHPVTLEKNTSKKQFSEILDAIDDLKNTNIIFTKTNSDTGGKIINSMIDEYTSKNQNKSISITSMGQLNFLSALKYMDFIIGNSSSGLLEAPSLKIGTINIGDRQKGRIKAKSIIDCSPNKKSIKYAIKKAYSNEFQNLLKNIKNPYGDGCPSQKIIKILNSISIDDLLKKSFFNVKFSL